MSPSDRRDDATIATSILYEVALERDRQDARWGEQNRPDGPKHDTLYPETTLTTAEAILAYYRGVCAEGVRRGDTNWFDVLLGEVYEARVEALRGDTKTLRAELVQVAAVAVAWVEALDRRTADPDAALDTPSW